MLPKVEIHQAFVWTCDECGRDSFVRAIHTPDSVVVESMCEQDGIEKYEAEAILEESGLTGQWCMAPSVVKCPHCGCQYETEEPGSTAVPE